MIGLEKRQAFTRILKAYRSKLKTKAGNFRASESTLKSIVQITNTTNYEFPILTTETNNGAAIRPEEIRLSTNDDFVIVEHQIYLLGKYKNETNEETFLLDYVPYELGNQTDLAALYDGNMEVSINNDIILKGYDLLKFRRVPEYAQFEDKAISNEALTLQPSVKTDKLISIEPNINLSGAKTNKIKIVLPKAISTFTFKGWLKQNDQLTIDSIMYIARGILIQNVASFQR